MREKRLKKKKKKNLFIHRQMATGKKQTTTMNGLIKNKQTND